MMWKCDADDIFGDADDISCIVGTMGVLTKLISQIHT